MRRLWGRLLASAQWWKGNARFNSPDILDCWTGTGPGPYPRRSGGAKSQISSKTDAMFYSTLIHIHVNPCQQPSRRTFGRVRSAQPTRDVRVGTRDKGEASRASRTSRTSRTWRLHRLLWRECASMSMSMHAHPCPMSQSPCFFALSPPPRLHKALVFLSWY